MRTIAFALVAVVFGGLTHAQDPVLPAIELTDSATIQPYGWTWSEWSQDRSDALSMIRLRADIDTDTRWSGFIETDLTNGARASENWLRQAFVTYEADDTAINVGRLFLAAPRATPPPFLLKTARYMRYPFSAFGWGVQLDTELAGWNVLVDVTGDSSRRFNQGDQFTHLESSARATRAISEQVTIGATYQVSADFTRISGEVTYADGPHTVNVVAYTSDTADGGWIFYGHEVHERIELHGQLDYQDGAGEELLTTIGVRFGITNRVQMIVDHEFAQGDTFARLQVRF